ncbi:MAG: tRNA uracil 4-sulfurtransferase ThiI [Candidatus Thorarchaeota archaeon]|jgi:thiamine biosynthesis protein ThiI
MSPEYSEVLVRYGEIGIKSKQTRKRMEDLLIKHIKSAMREAGVKFSKVRKEYGRIFIVTEMTQEASDIVSNIFGVVSVSPVVVIESDLDAILEKGVEMARGSFTKSKSFAVGSRRVGTHDYSSQDVREKLGAAILVGLPELELSVDLTSPEQSLYIEVRNQSAYLFTETIDGVGGMPTGSQGKVVCTLSSGLDSPIAAFKVMKRGCIPVFVNFDNTPYTNDDCKAIVTEQAQLLANYIHNFEVKLYIVPHGEDLSEAETHGPPKMTCIFCKRNMLRMAREIAIMENADAIVTGEIIGEQASQTTMNLRAINTAVCDFPILRPCAGDDKSDIEALAHKIGTYKFAEEGLSCCTLAPKHPVTRGKPSDVQKAEEDMNLDVLKNQVAQAIIITLRTG